jgi:lipopolysaccharide/colanic/teichoic acid biosynthesis glycosyltransferase
MILVAFYINLVSPGPVIFKQQRVGYKGKTFTFYKFRTMKINNSTSSHQTYIKSLINSEKPMEKLDHGRDPRIIPGGKLFRKTSLDELPQLFNVLKGNMSLIGPRPCIVYEAKEFDHWHKQRFDVLPGLTGLWQVSGKNRLTFKQMIRLDILYGKNLSFLADLKIFILTIPTVIGLIFEKALHAPSTEANNN